MESKRHRILKERAKEWLFGRGYNPVREEAPFLDGHLIIDVVGYKDNQPAIGIECGNLQRGYDEWIYTRLPFPVYRLSYMPFDEDKPEEISRYRGIPYYRLGERAHGPDPYIYQGRLKNNRGGKKWLFKLSHRYALISNEEQLGLIPLEAYVL